METLVGVAVKGGPTGLLLLVVASVIFGWLMPRRTHLEIVEKLEATIAKLEATVDEQKKQIGILLGRATP